MKVNSFRGARLAVSMLLIAAMIVTGFAVTQVKADDREFTKSSIEFAAQINAGWNLGNSQDADFGSGETGWGNPRVTQELIDTVKAKGFNTIRIPVTWERYINNGNWQVLDKNSDYKISDKKMKRVKEVVDYAVKNDMYIILNVHHENDWICPNKTMVPYDSNGDVDTAKLELIYDKFSKVWKQIAENFKDYNEKLIFEGCNEVREGDDWEGWDEAYDVMNSLNQTFVSSVRSTGGNNAKRYLLMNGYAAGISKSIIEGFEIPNDPANHLMFSMHAYVPQKFAFPPHVNGGYDDLTYTSTNLKSELGGALKRAQKKFVANGIPVIIGEFASVDKNNTEERVRHAKEYIQIAAEYGAKCLWWDNNKFGYCPKGTSSPWESEGLLDWNTKTWKFGEIADVIIEEANKHVGEIVAPVTTTTKPTTTAPTTTKPAPATMTTTAAPATTAPTATEPTGIIYGDADGNGEVNLKDVMVMRKKHANWDVPNFNKKNADCNADDDFNAKDIMLLRKFIAQWDVKLGPQE